MFTNDYIMRQIEMLSGALHRVFLKESKREESYEIIVKASEQYSYIEDILQSLVENGEYENAEDALFVFMKENILLHKSDMIEIAQKFYDLLNSKTDEQLNIANFPRIEILQGMEQVLKFYI